MYKFLILLQSILVVYLITTYAQVLNTDNPDRLLYLANEGRLIVAAKDRLLVVHPETLNIVKDVAVKPSEDTITTCRNKGRTQEVCANYHRVLLSKDNDTLLVCGTNAFSVRCDFRFASNLSVTSEQVPTDGQYQQLSVPIDFSLSTVDPSAGNVAMMLDGKFYGAIKYDSTIPNMFFKVKLSGSSLARTKSSSDDWISSKDFYPIKMFEYGDSVFLVYREQATEASDSDVIYTRIAKVCKDDIGTGSSVLYSWQWKTFVKTTLKCSQKYSSTRQYSYNEIVSVSDVFEFNGRAHIVGVFRNIETGPPASAVCVYAMDDIVSNYNNPYLYKSSTNEWVKSFNIPSINCNKIGSSPSLYVLISQPVTQQASMPLLLSSYTESSLRLSHVVVVPSVMALNGSECFVLLLGTEDGYVERSWSCGVYAEVFYKERVFDGEKAVKGMTRAELSGRREDVSVYVSSSTQVRRMSPFACNYDNTKSCVHDPLCAWSTSHERCFIRPHDYTNINNASIKYPDLTVDSKYVPVRPSGNVIRTPTARSTATTAPSTSTTDTKKVEPNCSTIHLVDNTIDIGSQLGNKDSSGGLSFGVALAIGVAIGIVVTIAVVIILWKLVNTGKMGSWSPRRQKPQKHAETENGHTENRNAAEHQSSGAKLKVSMPPSCETILETGGDYANTHAQTSPNDVRVGNGSVQDAALTLSPPLRQGTNVCERTVSLQSTSSDKPLLPSPN
ncbi:semaphorin-6A-like isoform X2 [Corticium candelabrum]|nr:semaphorin-6A-like isoform X2 [Corticium candelabrum]